MGPELALCPWDCAPTFARCLDVSQGVFLGKQEEDEPCELLEVLFLLCGSSNSMEIAVSTGETFSATQLRAELY